MKAQFILRSSTRSQDLILIMGYLKKKRKKRFYRSIMFYFEIKLKKYFNTSHCLLLFQDWEAIGVR